MALVYLGILIWAYSNHFDNGFYFDDNHTIVNNEYIRDISNIPTFFHDLASFGTMPNNRGYRPMVTTLNTIDYWIAGNKLNPFYFHLSIFMWYIVQCLLMFFIFKRIFDKSFEHQWNGYIALFATAYYALHTANAEAINYIIARSDTFSTFCTVATIAMFQSAKLRRFHLYLIPAVVGVYTKETGIMVAPLLFFYVLLIEQNVSIREAITFRKKKAIWLSVKSIIPVLVILVGIFLFNRIHFTPGSNLFNNPANRWDYFTSQWPVILSYITNWFVPTSLSADPDFKITADILTSGKVLGFLVISMLHVVAILASEKRKTAPVAFGIIWFFVALVPTSSLHPLVQVSNSHRMFFPYIGLALAVSWSIALLVVQMEGRLKQSRIKLGLIGLISVVLLGYAYGAHSRNKVWGSEESLWYDVTQKSPNNGRGLMNYGLVLMQAGEYDKAEPYFQKAVEMLPYWPYSHINLAILKEAQGDWSEATKHFELALRYGGTDNPEPYYFYARSLMKRGELDRAMDLLTKGHELSPKHGNINILLEQLKLRTLTPQEKLTAQLELVKSAPTADNLINLSLMQYNAKQFDACIESCRKAIELNPQSAIAYNNICSAYNAMKQWQNAAEACKKALEIDPNFERARNNLNWSLSELKKN